MSNVPELPALDPIELDQFSLNIEYYLKNDYQCIEDACAELPAIIEWINTKKQMMIQERWFKEEEVKEINAQTYFDLRGGAFHDKYDGKPTEYALSQAVLLDPTLKQAKRDLAIVAAWCTRLTDLQQTFQLKLELVRSSETTRRQFVENTANI